MYKVKSLQFEGGQRFGLIPPDMMSDAPRTAEEAAKDIIAFYDEDMTPETLKIRAKCFSPDFSVIRDITYVEIKNLRDLPEDVNYFPMPNEEEMTMLIASIEDHGILVPIIVWEKPGDRDYTVCGQSRVFAYRELYKRSKNPRYLTIPCYYLKHDEIDLFKAKSMMLDSNITYRTIPRHIRVHAILERYILKTAAKQHRNESNVAEELAKEFDLAKSTIYNYVKLRGLSPKLMKLIADGELKLKTAMPLAANTSIEYQEMLMNKIGIDGLNDEIIMKQIGIRDLKEEDLDRCYTNLMNESHVKKVRFSVACIYDEAYEVFDALKSAFLKIIRNKKNKFKKNMFSF